MRFGYKNTQLFYMFVFCIVGLCHSLMATVLHVNPFQSSITFTINQFGNFPVEGFFGSYSVMTKLKDTQTIEKVEVMIDVNSISTNHKTRDRHLRNKKFFDYRNYPYIKFVADGPISLKSTKVVGQLSIKGNIKEIELPVTFNYLKSKQNNQYVLKTTIKDISLNRNDFNIDAYPWIIADNVWINIALISQVPMEGK